MKTTAWVGSGGRIALAKFLFPLFIISIFTCFFSRAQTISPGAGMMIGSGVALSSENDLNLQGGGTLDVQGTLILKKNLVNLNSAASTLGAGLIEFSGTSVQVISGQNIFGDLRINNGSGISVTGDTRVNGVMKLKSGLIAPGSNNLLLGPAATDSGGSVSAMVVATGSGEFRKEFPTSPSFPLSFTFPVGDTSSTAEYSPVTVSFTGATFSSGNYLGVTLKNSPDPNPGIASVNYLKRYWNLQNNAITGAVTCGLTYTFTDADVVGSKANLFCLRSDPVVETFNSVSGNQLTGTVGSFSRFTGADPALQASFNVFLQGPYDSVNSHNMTNTLAATLPLGSRSDLTKFPSSQPYNDPTWGYDGTESVAILPSGIVDWVLVELRQADLAAHATGATLFARRAGFLKQDGSVVDLDGISPLKFYHASVTKNIFPVIRHRNHMAVMAANAAVKNGSGTYTYDFSSGTGQVWGGSTGMKKVDKTPLRWGMTAADANADNNIWNNDYTNFYVPSFFISNHYLPADFNLDANVWNNDYTNFYVPNFFISNMLP